MESFPDYLKAQLDSKRWIPADLHRASGIDATLIGRWLKGTVVPGVENARALATATGRPLKEVLVAAGLMTPEEADQPLEAPPSLSEVSDDHLLAEVGRRMRRGAELTAEQAEAEPDRYKPAGAPKRRGTGARVAK